MQRLCFLILLLPWLSLSAQPLPPAQPVTVSAGIFIGGLINKRNDGAYQLILREAARRSGITINEQVGPLKNAIMAVVNKQSLAIYGMTEALISQLGQENIITSYPWGSINCTCLLVRVSR